MCFLRKLSDVRECCVSIASPSSFSGDSNRSLASSNSASSAAFYFLSLMRCRCLLNLLGISTSKVKPPSICFSMSDRHESNDRVVWSGFILCRNIDSLARLMLSYNEAWVRGSGCSACGRFITKLSNWCDALRLRKSSCLCLRFSFSRSSSCS